MRDVTHGFEGAARLQRLLEGALLDLLRQAPDLADLAPQACVYLSLPDPRRVVMGQEAPPADASATPEDGIPRAALLVQRAARLARWPADPELREASSVGHSGVAHVMARAMSDLAEGRVRVALVVGVDSLLEADTLSWLERAQRLKVPGMPVGLRPGEAAAVVALEAEHFASARRARKLAAVREVRLGEEERTLLSRESPSGAILADLLTGLDGADFPGGSPAWLITDLNGESHRAMEWGNVVIRVRARHRGFSPRALWHPASSFGDTSAASGGVALCVAASALARGYAPSSSAVITSTSDGRGRAVLVLETARS
ncbi:hypothetical protein [Sorangium sp. So ce1000]|uniref:hypothetical protein n=1 Tax=Sorangium sp. So ce1000 TaxID=3133325 RepID=UPI003F5F6E33